jgi:collagen type III alpha
MRVVIAGLAGAALLATAAIAQPTSPVPGAQPGAKAPGTDLPNQSQGSGSAPIGPPATPANPSTPGASTAPGTPGAPSTPPGMANGTEAQKKLDTPTK